MQLITRRGSAAIRMTREGYDSLRELVAGERTLGSHVTGDSTLGSLSDALDRYDSHTLSREEEQRLAALLDEHIALVGGLPELPADLMMLRRYLPETPAGPEERPDGCIVTRRGRVTSIVGKPPEPDVDGDSPQTAG